MPKEQCPCTSGSVRPPVSIPDCSLDPPQVWQAITWTIKIWPEKALSELQDYFESTILDLFVHNELETYRQTFLFYTTHCIDSVSVEKLAGVFPNQKPWMNKEIQTLLRTRDTAFRIGDMSQYSAARADQKQGIRRDNRKYKTKIEDHFATNNPRQAWQGMSTSLIIRAVAPCTPPQMPHWQRSSTVSLLSF